MIIVAWIGLLVVIIMLVMLTWREISPITSPQPVRRRAWAYAFGAAVLTLAWMIMTARI